MPPHDPGRTSLRKRARVAYELGRVRVGLLTASGVYLLQVALADRALDARAALSAVAAAVLVWRGGHGASGVRFGLAASVAFAVVPRLIVARPPCFLPTCQWWCLGAIVIGAAIAAGVIALGSRRRTGADFVAAAVIILVTTIRPA